MPALPTGLTRDQFALALARLNPAYAYRWLDDGSYEWRGPGPELVDAAIIAAVAADEADATDKGALRTTVVQTAQSAVGVRFDALTNVQLRALVAILLHKEGALDSAGNVKPLSQWVR